MFIIVICSLFKTFILYIFYIFSTRNGFDTLHTKLNTVTLVTLRLLTEAKVSNFKEHMGTDVIHQITNGSRRDAILHGRGRTMLGM